MTIRFSPLSFAASTFAASTVAGLLIACSGEGAGEPSSDAGATSDGAGRDAAAPTEGGPALPDLVDGSDANDLGDTSATSVPDAHATPGSCCQRDPDYDGTCASASPIAYRCFCPGLAGIPASCIVTQGSLIVCCP